MSYPFSLRPAFILVIFISLTMQRCATAYSPESSEEENAEMSIKKEEARKRVESASKIRTVPNPRPTKSFNKPKRKGNG